MNQQSTTMAEPAPMRTLTARPPSHRKVMKTCLTLTALLVLGGVLGLHPVPTMVRAQTASNDDVTAAYFQVINAGFLSGDFSGLSAILAPDATLTQSNPAGKTTVFHGAAAIIDFYQNVLLTNFPGLQFTVDTVRDLSDSVVLAYEQASSPALTVPARCTHVFVVQQGRIVSYDWTTFFPGAP